MSAESADPQFFASEPAEARVEVTGIVAERLNVPPGSMDREFWGSLGFALALHALALVSVGYAVPRHVGEADGSADGISVSVVTEADLRSQATTPAEPPPGQPTPQPQAAAPPPPPPPAPAAEPAPELKPSQLPDEVAKTEPASEAAKAAEVEAAIEKDVPDLLALPKSDAPKAEPKIAKKDPAAQPKKPETAQKPQPQSQPQPKRVAKLDLTPPAPSLSGPSGGGGRRAGMERPPGITRSGANDDFARGVIRALQGTMPQLREVLGRVTVRIILNENGNVADVQVVRPANVGQIDQSVVFAAKQTSYPFPPPNSNLADRTFLITYIYH